VHTLREPFSDGIYAEAGAGRITRSSSTCLWCRSTRRAEKFISSKDSALS
jgi:hypothetical protein